MPRVKLAIDRCSLLNEQALDLLPLRAGLMSDELHAEDGLRVLLGVLASLRNLHAAALAAASSVNLRLDHNARRAFRKQLARHVVGFFEGVGYFALRHGDAVLRQDFFRLILVNFILVGTDPSAEVGVRGPALEARAGNATMTAVST